VSDENKVQVHKVVLLVVDHDGIGVEEVADLLTEARYPNHCMMTSVMHIETREVDWSDDHPLNAGGDTLRGEFGRLFGEPGAVFDARAAAESAKALRSEVRLTLAQRADARLRVAELEAEVARLRALVDGAPLTVAGLVHTAHEAAKAKGWHEGADPTSPTQVLAWLALLHSEVSEAVEDVRKGLLVETVREDGKPEGLPSELADVLIRLADTCGALGIDLEGAIRRKMAYNATRAHRHGGKVA